MQKEKIRWITVKGTHIPIKEGQTAKEATATFFARQNASYAEIMKETGQREQEKSDLTGNAENGKIEGAQTTQSGGVQKTYSVIAPTPNTRTVKEGTRIAYGKGDFHYKGDLHVSDVITIFPWNKLREGPRVAKNTGKGYGLWEKKGGNVEVEISGQPETKQIHWFEMRGQNATGYKIVK